MGVESKGGAVSFDCFLQGLILVNERKQHISLLLSSDVNNCPPNIPAFSFPLSPQTPPPPWRRTHGDLWWAPPQPAAVGASQWGWGVFRAPAWLDVCVKNSAGGGATTRSRQT